MLVIGLLLLAAAAAVGAAGVAANTGTEHQLPGGFAIFGYHLHGSAGRLFLAGLIVGAVAMLGFMMVADGLRRSAAQRRELGRFRRDARTRRRGVDAPAPATGAATTTTVATEERETVAQRDADVAADAPARRGLRNWRTVTR